MKYLQSGKKPQAAQTKQPITDIQFLAAMSVTDYLMDAADEEFEQHPVDQAEVVDNMATLCAWIDTGLISDEALEQYAISTPGLNDIYGKNVEEFKTNLKNQVIANEGWLDGLVGDFNTGLLGAVIAWARNSLPNLKKQLEICKDKLANTSDEKIFSRSNQHLIRVRSKYLPSVKNFEDAVAALGRMLKAIEANPESQDESPYVEQLKGSMYWDEGAQKKKGQQNTSWKYIGVRILPSVLAVSGPVAAGVKFAQRYYFEPAQPVGERGWNSRAVYEKGIDDISALVNLLEETIAKTAKKPDTKCAAHALKWAQKEIVYLGRGLTTAIRKVYAGGFVRFVSNRVIH